MWILKSNQSLSSMLLNTYYVSDGRSIASDLAQSPSSTSKRLLPTLCPSTLNFSSRSWVNKLWSNLYQTNIIRHWRSRTYALSLQMGGIQTETGAHRSARSRSKSAIPTHYFVRKFICKYYIFCFPCCG
jgi:hypothetical protein